MKRYGWILAAVLALSGCGRVAGIPANLSGSELSEGQKFTLKQPDGNVLSLTYGTRTWQYIWATFTHGTGAEFVNLAEVIPPELLREQIEDFPEVSEVEIVRHFTRLSTWNYGVDTGAYPLGSCTMKYNPKINERVAALPGFARPRRTPHVCTLYHSPNSHFRSSIDTKLPRPG